MDTMLLAVTIAALGLAAVTSVLAWRVMREERVRSAARIATLAAAIGRDDDRTVSTGDLEAPIDIDRTIRPELPLRDAPAAAAGPLFAARQPTASRFRLVAVVAAGAIVVAAAIGTLVALSGPPQGPAATGVAASRSEPLARTPTEIPLELVALGHEREVDRITVRGVVRNPAIGAAVNELTAVVQLFGSDGELVGSASAEIDAAAVAPGAERTFVVSVPARSEVGRYRVSFRSANDVIPHVDRRG